MFSGESIMIRVGFGFDVHRLVAGRPLFIGGVEIPYHLGLLGHSDADVLIHAFCDALLGAAALGDIGRHFPDSDPQYKGISSLVLLKRTSELLRQKGFLLSNADLTLVAQAPKIAGYAQKMQVVLSGACEVSPEVINIKATTTEGLGLTGTGEAMAAYAVVLIKSKF